MKRLPLNSTLPSPWTVTAYSGQRPKQADCCRLISTSTAICSGWPDSWIARTVDRRTFPTFER